MLELLSKEETETKDYFKARLYDLETDKELPRDNIVLNKIEKKKKEVVTKAENNYLSRE